jgi:hypothetical protein
LTKAGTRRQERQGDDWSRIGPPHEVGRSRERQVSPSPQRVSQDLWPTPIVWASQAQPHVYDLKAVEVDAQLAIVPVYDFRRTLGTAEPEPEVSWVRPTRYLF